MDHAESAESGVAINTYVFYKVWSVDMFSNFSKRPPAVERPKKIPTLSYSVYNI